MFHQSNSIVGYGGYGIITLHILNVQNPKQQSPLIIIIILIIIK